MWIESKDCIWRPLKDFDVVLEVEERKKVDGQKNKGR